MFCQIEHKTLLFFFVKTSIVLSNLLENNFDSQTISESNFPTRCIAWIPRDQRQQTCIHTLQRLIGKLSVGNFTRAQDGRFDPKVDLAPERDWLPLDRETRALFQNYSNYPPDNSFKCLQGHSVFFVGRLE
mmetsp:Transcript_30895/g.42824  ORF Transcript_30895/g.42824 Transcript_30895/m.42824 type:complete len:131 (+) Transcript_30895:285-677(+)